MGGIGKGQVEHRCACRGDKETLRNLQKCRTKERNNKFKKNKKEIGEGNEKKKQTGRNNWEQHNKGRVIGREIVAEEEVAVNCGKAKERG